MKLHTDFHDYYDYAVGYGVDEKVHYNRFAKDAEIIVKSPADLPRDHNTGLLGFCGTIYPFIELTKYAREYDDEYDADDNEIVEWYYAFSLEEYAIKETEWADFSPDFGSWDSLAGTRRKRFFIDWSFQSDEIFRAHGVPVWLMRFYANEVNGLLNPCLKDYGFDRIKDAFAAFQDISTYLANILVEQKETAAVADKFRIEQHGFDLKKSFRKEKKNRR